MLKKCFICNIQNLATNFKFNEIDCNKFEKYGII